MNIKKCAYFITFLLMLGLAHAGEPNYSAASQAGAETIEKAVHQALIYYPSIKKAQASEREAEYILQQSRGGFLPTVDTSYSAGRQIYTGPTVISPSGVGQTILHRIERNIAFSQPIFSGFSSVYEVKQRKGELKTASFQTLGEKENVALQAAKAYIEVLRANQFITLAQQNVKDHLRTLASTRMQFRGGYSPKADVDLAAARVDLASSTLSSMLGNQQNALNNYQQVIGHVPSELVYPSPPLYCQTCNFEKFKHQALEKSPAYKGAIEKVKSTYFAVVSARGTYYPQVSADVSESYNNDLDGVPGAIRDQKFLLSIKYNMINGGMDYAKVQQAVERYNQAKQELDQARISVVHDVTEAWNNIQVARRQVDQYAQYVKATRATVNGYEAQFKIGSQSLFNVLSMKDELFQARQDYVTAKYNFLLYQYQMLAVMGSLSMALS